MGILNNLVYSYMQKVHLFLPFLVRAVGDAKETYELFFMCDVTQVACLAACSDSHAAAYFHCY